MQEADVFETPLDEQVPVPAQKKEQISMFDRKYVEDTIKIRCSDFGKGVLVPVKAPQKNQFLIGKSGDFVASIMAYDLFVRYSVNLNSNSFAELNINYKYDDGGSFYRSQTIRLVGHELTFGTSWSFVCNICNKPRKSLFLPRGDSFFACRSCKGLFYGKCFFKKHIPHHQSFYGLNRINKVISNCPNYKRYSYNKRPTKKFLNAYKLYLKERVRFSDNMTNLMEKYNISWELRDYAFKHGLCS